jgi:2-octaprenyl-6-methoxyphenol hydroxylase
LHVLAKHLGSAHTNINMGVKNSYDIAIVGGGPAGLAAACLIAELDLNVICWSGPPRVDLRTTALMQGSIRLLNHLGVWGDDTLKSHCAPLKHLEIVDATGRPPRAPTVVFDATELGEEPFGWNVPVTPLTETLTKLLKTRMNSTLVPGSVTSVIPASDRVTIDSIETGKLEVKLVLAADGRNSLCRKAAGIGVSKWSYPQMAVVTTFSHTEPHGDVSIEFHRKPGPLTTVPLPGKRSSLVWVETEDKAVRLRDMDATRFCRELAFKLQNRLGTISDITPRAIFPIGGMAARKYANNRVLLIGEAGHTIPPIGAQGLNISLRDGALAVEFVTDALANNDDIGARHVMSEYDMRRRKDIFPRQVAVDLLNRSLISGFLPFQGARSVGLAALQKIGPLRRQIMREGLTPTRDLPKLMQS